MSVVVAITHGCPAGPCVIWTGRAYWNGAMSGSSIPFTRRGLIGGRQFSSVQSIASTPPSTGAGAGDAGSAGMSAPSVLSVQRSAVENVLAFEVISSPRDQGRPPTTVKVAQSL